MKFRDNWLRNEVCRAVTLFEHVRTNVSVGADPYIPCEGITIPHLKSSKTDPWFCQKKLLYNIVLALYIVAFTLVDCTQIIACQVLLEAAL